MRPRDKMATESVRVIGEVMLFCSGVLWLLFLGNLRSRIFFGGPAMNFLVWLALYTAIIGFGLFFLQKWAIVINLAACIVIGTWWIAVIPKHEFRLFWLLNGAIYAGGVYLLGIVPLRHWRELK